MADEVTTETKQEEVVPKAHLLDAISTRDAAKARAKELEDKLAKYETAEKDRQTQDNSSKEKQTRESLAKDGKWADLEKVYESSLKSVDENYKKALTSKDQLYEKRIVPTAIKQAAMKVKNINPEALDDLSELLSRQVKLNFDSFEPVVVDQDGKPKLMPSGVNGTSPVSLDFLVEETVKAKPYFLLGVLPKGTGTKAGAGQSGAATYTIEQALVSPKINAEWKAADPEGHAEAFREYARNTLLVCRRRRERD